ncbi:MAG: EAL domain-containing response regulator [Betaproteobacteria bacterium]|nr:EAL domain-containing response regulator [Betaproteobacteria bacterium]
MEKLSVLVLDDDDFILDVVHVMLKSFGVTDITCDTSAAMALPTLDMDNPRSVVLCDLNMPEMDGVEVVRYLGQQGFCGGVIVFSGEDSRLLQTVAEIGRAHHLRLLGALGKPIDRQALSRMLQNMAKDASALHHRPHVTLSAAELRDGLENDALTPYFQPQVDTLSRRVIGVEALARWRHPAKGILSPAAFISVAEQNALIAPLTERMITLSLRQWQLWNAAGLDLTISVNLSMHSLTRLDFPERLVAEAQSIGVPLDRLVLEITESQVSQDILVSSDVLARLCLKRVRLSIDDFGTAYSNMEKLQMLPFSELKIDQAFIHGAAKKPASYAIVKSSADLGRDLGMKIVAEGVETQEDWDCAGELGCDLIQGYFIARPMPGDQMPGWVRSWKWR